MATREAVSQVHNAVGVGVPVTVTGITLLGIGLQDWVYLGTLLVIATQLIRAMYAGWKWWQRRKENRRHARKIDKVTTPEPRE